MKTLTTPPRIVCMPWVIFAMLFLYQIPCSAGIPNIGDMLQSPANVANEAIKAVATVATVATEAIDAANKVAIEPVAKGAGGVVKKVADFLWDVFTLNLIKKSGSASENIDKHEINKDTAQKESAYVGANK